MFELAGDTPVQAAARATRVMTVETELARGSLPASRRRDPHKLFHKMGRE